MTAPWLVPCLVELRAEFNEENPNRDKGADGWIGDEAHQKEVSDHNPDSQGRVLAIDIDSTGPWPDKHTLANYVGFTLLRCRSGEEERLEYIIWDHHIYERKNAWKKRVYDRDDPHTNHAHFSARHDHVGQNDRNSWNLWEVSMPTVDEFAQAVASKLHKDLKDPASGLALDMAAIERATVLALYNDLNRNPGTTNPDGQSGLNRLFRQIVREEVQTLLTGTVPPTA